MFLIPSFTHHTFAISTLIFFLALSTPLSLPTARSVLLLEIWVERAKLSASLLLPPMRIHSAANPAADLAAVLKNTGATLPQVSSGGTVTMTLHQLNANGAGPMECSIDATAQGASFQAMTITTFLVQTGRAMQRTRIS